MLKIDENKLIETIKDAIREGNQVGYYGEWDFRNYLLNEIIQENMLNMDDDDIHKLFLAVEDYFNKGKHGR